MGAVFFGIRKSRISSLPDQKDLLDACLRPGRKVHLVLGSPAEADRADVRETILCGLEKKKLFLAQTMPRLNHGGDEQELFVTFLAATGDGGRVRVGYRTMLENTLEHPEAMLVVPAPKKLSRLTLRLDSRLAPPAGYVFKLFLLPRREELSLADISRSGIRFTHPGHMGWKPGEQIDLLLAGPGRELGIRAQVVRGESANAAGNAPAGVTAARFLPGQTDESRRLDAMLGEIHDTGGRTPAPPRPPA